MSLKNIEENLYKREENKESSHPEDSRQYGLADGKIDPFGAAFLKTEKEDKSAIWIKEDEEKKTRRKKILKIVAASGAALVLVAGIVWGTIYFRKGAFSEDKVTVSLSGPNEVQSGDVAAIVIDYRNDNRASLKDAVLHIAYGSNFKPAENFNLEPEGPGAGRFNVGPIEGKSAGNVELRGNFFGAQETTA